ncbi:hypothetical protein F5I97DRAFT_1382399 [Phlebopus sp. FC_14]|nr:hypothetical protein F5I97DRAFT_1382399 [Phlebopus sp. FC_14]
MEKSDRSFNANSALDRLPNELLLEVISYLPLKSLIAARGVNSSWRTLVLESDLLQVRRKLLHFYLSVIRSPSFLAARQPVVRQLYPFDRDRYLDSYIQRSLEIPEEFEFYVREWPAKAAITWLWPGLLQAFQGQSSGRIQGRNCLGSNRSPGELYFPNSEDDEEEADDATCVRALELWEHGCAWSDWLICDKSKDKSDRIRFGEVYACEGSWVNWEDKEKQEARSFIDWLAQRVRDVFDGMHSQLTYSA